MTPLPTIPAICAAVASTTGTHPLVNQGTRQPAVAARDLAAYAARQLTRMSYPELAEPFGTGHSTVIERVQRYEKRLHDIESIRVDGGVMLACEAYARVCRVLGVEVQVMDCNGGQV